MPEHRIEGVGEVDAEDLLDLLGADNVHPVGNDEIGFSCLYVAGHANGDQNPSAHINRDKLLWRCKGCGRAGNLPELVRTALPHGTTFPEALAWLRENFGAEIRKPHGGSLDAEVERLLADINPPAPPIRRLPAEADTIGPGGMFRIDWRSDHPAAVYMRGRGFAPEVLEDWGVGYDDWTRRVAIPVRDERGVLVGFKGRSLVDQKIKYLLLGDAEYRQPRYGFDMHDHNTVVFGLDRARGHKRVALCEGELNVIACHAAGVPAVAPGTTSITAQQLWLLRAHFNEIVNFYDSDKAGNQSVQGYFDDHAQKWRPGLVEKITPYFRFYIVGDHEGDSASMPAQEIRDLYASARHWTELVAST